MFEICTILYPEKFSVLEKDYDDENYFCKNGIEYSLQFLVNDDLEPSLEMSKKLFVEITGVKDIDDFLNEKEGKYIVPINKTEEELFYLSLKHPLISELIKEGCIRLSKYSVK